MNFSIKILAALAPLLTLACTDPRVDALSRRLDELGAAQLDRAKLDTAIAAEQVDRAAAVDQSLSAAKQYTDSAVASEAQARAAGESDVLTRAEQYADGLVARVQGAKVAHLVVDKTGEDLGVLLAMPGSLNTVLSPKLGGEIDVSRRFPVVYALPNCDAGGASMIVYSYPPRLGTFYNLPDGRLAQASGAPTAFTYQSFLDEKNKCSNSTGTLDRVPYVVVNKAPVYHDASELRVKLL